MPHGDLINIVQFKNRFVTIAVSAMGVSLLVQVLAFLRQLLIAAYFGIGRDFDAYVMVYTMATVLVFTFGGIFDSVAVPRLVRALERDGAKRAHALARSIFRLSLLLSGGISLTFLVAVPLLAPIFATGFSPDERANLTKLAWYFLPWTLVCVPYYAAAARHKMEWGFNRVFAAEIVTVVVSTGCVVLWHGDIRVLPLAYAVGYGVALLQLAVGSALWRSPGDMMSPSVRGVIRNVGELFLANQTAGLASLLDRHFQSFLVVGGIGAVNYSTQIIASLSSLLTLREIYTVPLTQQADRAERLGRLLCGLLLLAVPLASLIAYLAPELVQVLLQRGRFDATASALTAAALRIAAFSLITSTVMAPLVRVFQIIDRIHLVQVVYLSWAGSILIFGYLFVVMLGWGVQGVASMQLAGSVTATIATAFLVDRCGIRLRWGMIFSWFAFAVAISGIAYLVTVPAVSGLENLWLRLTVGGAVYGGAILVGYFLVRAKIRHLVLGVG